MFSSEKKVTIELSNGIGECKNVDYSKMTNPMSSDYGSSDKLALMVRTILNEELPDYKNNSLLYDLVLYSVIEKANTVQNIENVLSYIKDNNVKEVNDVTFRKGEVFIKCSI